MSESDLSSPEPVPTEEAAEPGPASSAASATSPLLDPQHVMSLEVPVQFGLGTSRVSLQELSTLQPGYIFQTDTPTEQPVTIEVNGRAVGKGDLVAIDGRIGVVVREYFGNG